MLENSLLQISFYFLILLLFIKPLGTYMARVYEGKSTVLSPLLKPIERFIYQLCFISPEQEMDWKAYIYAMLFLNFFGFLIVYFMQRLQFYLPLNPQNFTGLNPDLAFNIAASFTTNTDWQPYSGESSLGYLTQMMALTVQNFLSAATGMSLLLPVIRGFVRVETNKLGNFWVDTVRGVLYILLPLSVVLSVALVAQGVIQNNQPYQNVVLLQPSTYQQEVIPSQLLNPVQVIQEAAGKPKLETIFLTDQTLPMGPVASQVAIKQLGSNGGGFFNANSAHPFENPTPLSNFLEMLAILLIPASLCYTFGVMVKDKRQGWSLLLAMAIIFIPSLAISTLSEQNGNPAFKQLSVDPNPQFNLYSAGNMEGKETRFGIVNSTLWATLATASSNGSANAMFDSFMPLGGLMPLWLMQLGEVVFGGVGSGLYGMLMMVILTVFIAGLMVGRTPEYLGKKIEPFEMKMASIAVLLMPVGALILTAIASVTYFGLDALGNLGAHGFTEMLYAFTSQGNNNGSIFAGLKADKPFYTISGGIEMLLLRYWAAIPCLALAGSLSQKKQVPISLGTLPTHTLLFVILLAAVLIVFGALTFFPALALGPIVEQLTIWGLYGH